MILTYQECIDKYGSDYQLKKELFKGDLYMKEKGIYSTKQHVSETDIIMHKYSKAVFTGKSAFYYHSLSDVIPDHYYLATKRSDTRINNPLIIQSFLKEDIFEAGIITKEYNGSKIRLYNRERMLIELMRFKASIPLDYYKEVIHNYRNMTFDLDFVLIEKYANLFNNSRNLLDMVQMEVL